MLLVLAATVFSASPAEAVTYHGGGEGIKIEFRVAGGRIVFAEVRVTLHCAGQTYGSRTRRLGAVWNSERLLPGVTEYHSHPIDLRAGGRFRESSSSHAEAGYIGEELFAGRVRRGAVVGGFLSVSEYRTPARKERCQTGGAPGAGENGFVAFRADRR